MNTVRLSSVIGLGVATALIGCVCMMGHGQSAAAGDDAGKRWLALMDGDADGTVSKKELNKFMDAQFDKADVDHDGTLDAKELEELRKSLTAAAR